MVSCEQDATTNENQRDKSMKWNDNGMLGRVNFLWISESQKYIHDLKGVSRLF